MSCSKAFLFFFNFIYLAIAAAIIWVAVWFVEQFKDYTEITTSTYTIVPFSLILSVAVLIIVTVVIGCCGTCQENKCCLSVFFIFLFIIFGVLVSAGVLGSIYKNEGKQLVKEGLHDALEHYDSKKSALDIALDNLQEKFKCCGNDGPGNWLNTTFGKNGTLPSSCCDTDGDCEQNMSTVYKKGCYDKLLSFFDKNLSYIIGIGVGFAIFQLLGMIGTCYVMCTFRRSGYTVLGNDGVRV